MPTPDGKEMAMLSVLPWDVPSERTFLTTSVASGLVHPIQFGSLRAFCSHVQA